MLDWLDIILRLGIATAIGGIIGVNRELHRKPTGLRTLGLVGLGSALVVLVGQHAGSSFDANAASRVIQGVITGIGFLGAGVILRGSTGSKIHGLTTSATIWVTACLGLVCGFGAWRLVIVAGALVAILLIAGGPLEEAIQRHLGKDEGNNSED